MTGTSACFNKSTQNDEFGETIMAKIKPYDEMSLFMRSFSQNEIIFTRLDLFSNYDETET